MAYLFALTDCFICGQPFEFNPDLVPCVLVGGRAQPLCFDCLDLTNLRRQVAGLRPLDADPAAYTRPHAVSASN